METKTSIDVTTLSFAYTLYAREFPERDKFVKTAILRYLLPYSGFGFNFQVDADNCLSSEEVVRGLELIQKLNLEDLSDIERVLSWQAEVFKLLGINENIRSSYKSYLKHFLKWCQAQGWLKPKKYETWAIPASPEKSKRHGRGRKDQHRITNRRSVRFYSVKLEQLSQEVQSQIKEYERFWTDPHYGSRPIRGPIDQASSCADSLRVLLQILGWRGLDKLDYHSRMCEHALLKQEKNPDYESDWLLVDVEPPDWLKEMQRKYPPKPFDELKPQDLITVVETRVSHLVLEEAESYDSDHKTADKSDETKQLLDEIQAELKAQNATLSMAVILKLVQGLQPNPGLAEEIKKLTKLSEKGDARERAQEAAQEAAKAARSLVDDFLKWLKYQHNPMDDPEGHRITNNYAGGCCDAVLNLAKFLYRDITDSLMSPNYQDISVVMALRALRNDLRALPEKENVVHPIKRNPTWKELGQLLKLLLINCAPRIPVPKHPRKKTGPLRAQDTVARDLQRYLIVMFFRLISPDRQHVVRSLRVHDTLRLYWLNWEIGDSEEAPWDSKSKRYRAYYNTHTKLYYLDPKDAKDEMGNVPEMPQGKAFEWVVCLDKTQTKINKDNAYRVPKIYNPELQAWLYGREDYSGTWHNWPRVTGGGKARRNQWHCKQYNWCGYIEVESGSLAGFRDAFAPTHDFVFTQTKGEPFTGRGISSLYENVIWTYLGFRANPHGVRSAASSHYKRKGITDAQSDSLAKIKSHSRKMQDSSAYTKLDALEETALASQMIVDEFLEEQGLDSNEYGFAYPQT